MVMSSDRLAVVGEVGVTGVKGMVSDLQQVHRGHDEEDRKKESSTSRENTLLCEKTEIKNLTLICLLADLAFTM